MPNAQRLDILRQLREEAGLSQAQMARLCGLTGRQSRLTVGAWERGDYAPDARRRTWFVGYLWDELRLRRDPQKFQTVWAILAEEWGWALLNEAEWRALTMRTAPITANVQPVDSMASQVDLTSGQTGMPPPLTTYRRALDITLYTTEVTSRAPVLFGRAPLLAQAHTALATTKRVLLYGLGGAGKTALAATLANHWLRDQRGLVLWVQTGDTTAETLLEGLVDQFATEAAKADYHRRLDKPNLQAIGALVQQSGATLLILDDVWNGNTLYHIHQALPATLALVVTSRLKFPEFTRIEVGDLAATDAVALLGYYAGGKAYSADQAAQQLCKALGNHPYALEIAGKVLALEEFLSPAQLYRQIAQAPHTVAMPGDFAQEGHTSVKHLLDRSFLALTPEQQTIFTCFGRLYAPGATAALLATCLTQEISAVEKGLGDLIQRCLVRQSKPQYYELHDLTFSYVKALAQAQPEASQDPIQMVTRYVTEQSNDFGLLSLDQPNIIGAAQAAQTSQVEAFIAILSALALGGYFGARGYTKELLKLLDDAIAINGKRGEAGAETQHYLLSQRGNAYDAMGDFPNALTTHQAALALAPNLYRRVVLLAALGSHSVDVGNQQQADDYFREATDLAEVAHDYEALSFVIGQQSYAAGQQKDYKTVRDLAARGIELSLAYGRTNEIGYYRLNLGSAEFDLGLQAALHHHQAAYADALASNDEGLLASAHKVLGRDYLALEDIAKAAEHFACALALFEKTGQADQERELCQFLVHFAFKPIGS